MVHPTGKEKSEKDKMLAGELYNAQDPVLVADRLHSAAAGLPAPYG